MAVGKTGFSPAMFTRNVDLRIIAEALIEFGFLLECQPPIESEL
jgi:hypothetical protein